jgi:biotin carboxylase
MTAPTNSSVQAKRPRIWFNKSLSSTSFVVETVRKACRPGEEFFFVCTHTSPSATVAPVADLFEVEPVGLGAEAYVDWCVDFARTRAVDVFIPRNYASSIAAQRQRFEDLGVKVILAAEPAALSLIKNKGLFYEALGQDLVPQPAFQVVANLAQFQEGFIALSARHNKVCFKPTEGIGGKGFKVLTVGGPEIYSPWDHELLSIEYDAALVELAQKASFPELMMMEYLPGQERSVDCLAQDGKLLAAVTRLKSYDGNDELLEDNPLLVEYCRRITAKIGLKGLYYVQFMASEIGDQYLLEVNARMSGGIHYGALSGVCLPYWAIRLALGTAKASDIPAAKAGIRISRATREILV